MLTQSQLEPKVKRTLDCVRVTVNGSTTDDVHSVSLLFRGTGGTLDGAAVPNNFIVSFSPNAANDTVAAIAYTVPTAGVQEIIITYVL